MDKHMNKPKIVAIREPAPNFPDAIEVELEWEGEYKTLLSFSKSDFENDAKGAHALVAAHVSSVKRRIDFLEIVAALKARRAAAEALMQEQRVLEVLKMEKLKAEVEKESHGV